MPYILPTRCGDPMCGELATHRGRCDRHQRQPWANPSANGRALSGSDRRRWHNLIIKADTVCEQCGAQATEADHRIPISEGGAHFDPANGTALCRECHAQKTQLEQSRRTRKG